MLVIDTHAHLNFDDYDKDRDEVIGRSLNSNVWMINVGCDWKGSEFGVWLAEKNKEGIFAAVALHPTNIFEEKFNYENYRQLAVSSEKVVAIGETGLDYAVFAPERSRGLEKRAPRPSEDAAGLPEAEVLRIKQAQKEIFLGHLKLADELKEPIIIHARKSHDDILGILADWQKNHNSKLRGVAHSFSGNWKQARQYRELGFKIAFNGIITFARDYDKVILDTPLEDILIETDCPFLTPVPCRGKRNEPMYVIEVAKKLAELKNISLEEVAERTTENAREFFGI